MNFFKLNISMNNPQIILKLRIYFEENIILDLGILNLTNNYSKVYGKVFNNKEEWRWISTYHITIQNITMEKNSFKILEESNGIINIHLTIQTENDKKLNNLEFDNSLQFDLFFDHFKLTLRQNDYTFLMSCLDLNILYTDNQNEKYNFEKFNDLNNENILKKNESMISDLNTKELMEKYLSMFCVIFFQEISVNLCLKNEEMFSSLNVKDNLIIFLKN